MLFRSFSSGLGQPAPRAPTDGIAEETPINMRGGVVFPSDRPLPARDFSLSPTQGDGMWGPVGRAIGNALQQANAANTPVQMQPTQQAPSPYATGM